MNLVNITPKMTSDNTPAPYSCYASSVWSGYPAWKAFDGDDTGLSYWHAAQAAGRTGYLVFDFGNKTKVAAFTLYNVSHGNTYNPTVIHVYGSDDGTTFTLIKSFTVKVALNKNVVFYFDEQVNYRAYKFNMTSGGSYISIQELIMYEDKDQVSYSIPIRDKTIETIKNNELFQHLVTFSKE